ncbi:MAG: hypothetical protein IJ111_14080 [Eggerthellaceae bacterium]|nr:hypothetical protein [Eggerthellaceae bacterium]
MESGIMQDVEIITDELGFLEDNPKAKIVLAVIAVVIALLSFFVIADIASSAETHSQTISSLDEKKGTVMGLVAASTAASAAVSLLPGDAGTPIAQKLVDLSSDFLIVITAIYLEKYLLTTLGFAAFKILIPLGCLVFAGSLFIRKRLVLQRSLRRLASKLALFGIAIFLVVPVSIGVSGMIESTYKDSVDETIALANQTVEGIESESSASSVEAESTGLFDWIADIPSNVGNAVTDLTADAQKALNGFIEALAVMVVTSCIIPIVVLVFFLWLVKVILGVDMSATVQMVRPRVMHRPGR